MINKLGLSPYASNGLNTLCPIKMAKKGGHGTNAKKKCKVLLLYKTDLALINKNL